MRGLEQPMLLGDRSVTVRASLGMALSEAGVTAYGVVYGIYNVAWAVGLMAGPALGGVFLERAGFGRLTVGWSALLLITSLVLARLR